LTCRNAATLKTLKAKIEDLEAGVLRHGPRECLGQSEWFVTGMCQGRTECQR